jgi:O-antigen ligase
MSAFTFAAPQTENLRGTPAEASNVWVWVTAAIVALAFFISEHDVNVSLHEAFTESAEEMAASASGGNPMRRLAFLMLGGMGVAMAAAAGKHPWRLNKPMAIAVLLLFGWSLASIFWSVDPSMCLRRQIVLVCWVVAAFGLARFFTLRQLCWMTMIVTATLATAGVLSELRLGTFRPWLPDHRFSGSLHPNSQGMLLGTLCLSSLALAFDLPAYRKRCLLVFACGFGLLLLTRSRTATGALLIASSVVASLQFSLRLKSGIAFTGLWLVGTAALLVMLLGVDLSDEMGRAVMLGRQQEDADSLSGRFLIWPEVLHYIGKRPLAGYGYDSFWTADHIDAISARLQWGLREAHCTYLEIILSIGVVGLAFAMTAVLCGLATSIAEYVRSRNSLYAYVVGFIVFGLIDGLLESGMGATSLTPFLGACVLLRMAVASDRASNLTKAQMSEGKQKLLKPRFSHENGWQRMPQL